MSNYEDSYTRIDHEILDLAKGVSQSIIATSTPRNKIVQLAATVDLLVQELLNFDSGDPYVFYLRDSSLITESEYEAANRVFEAINKHLGMNISIRFEQYSDWLPDDPGPFKPKEVPTVSIALAFQKSYLDMVEKVLNVKSIEGINKYLLFILLNTIGIVQSADRLYDDAYIVQLMEQSEDLSMNDHLSIQSEWLTDLIFDEISEVSKKRFGFNARLWESRQDDNSE